MEPVEQGERKAEPVRRHTATYVILLILLALRFADPLAVLLELNSRAQGGVPAWESTFAKWTYLPWLLGSLPLIAAVLFLNRNELDRLNIDRSFVAIFLACEIVVVLECFGLGLIAGLLATAVWLLVLIALLRNRFAFGGSGANLAWAYLVIVIIFVGVLLIRSPTWNLARTGQSILFFFGDSIPDAMIEEVVFRGMLWMFLFSLGWKRTAVFWVQAAIFWLAHFDRIVADPVFFWFGIPIASVVLGYIVLRSKCIGPSTVAHILINFMRLPF